jgi:hypothetical protein
MMDIDGRTIERPIEQVTWTPAMTQTRGYERLMEKEEADRWC